MQISFADLEKALAPIEQVGQGETTFDVGTTPVTLRLLTPEEELEVQKYANQALDEEGGTVPIEYADRMKLSLLCFAIIQVGDQDLRNVDFVETGDKLDNGKSVKEPKHLALRKIVKRWTSPVRTGLFQRYSDLVVKVEQKAEAAFNYTPMDLNTEIERLEKRAAQLKKELERRGKGSKTGFGETVKIIASVDDEEKELREKDMDTYVASGGKPKKETEEKVETSQARRSIIPNAAPALPTQPSVQAPVKVPVEQPKASVEQSVEGQGQEIPDFDEPDSFADLDDQESLQKSMDAETRRLIEARRSAGGRPAPNVSGPVRRPPHLDALETEESLMRQAVEEAPSRGLPVFRLPAQEIGAPQQQGNVQGTQPNQTSDKTTRNPNFRKPQLLR